MPAIEGLNFDLNYILEVVRLHIVALSIRCDYDDNAIHVLHINANLLKWITIDRALPRQNKKKGTMECRPHATRYPHSFYPPLHKDRKME